MVKIITAAELYKNVNTTGAKLLSGIGISGAGITSNEFAARIIYEINLTAGNYEVVVKCLPTFAMEKEKQLTYNIALNNETAQSVNVHAEAESSVWKENVLRGYSQGESQHIVAKDGVSIIKMVLKNKNLVISQVEIYKIR
jgi:hypothetical protein